MFDIHQSIHDSESGQLDEDKKYDYIDGILQAFHESPECRELPDNGDIRYCGMFLDYVFNYIRGSLPNLSASEVREVVFEIFPRKVSMSAESGPRAMAEWRAFFAFLDRQYQLRNAKQISEVFTEDAERRFCKELANPANFSMAKSMVMQGIEAGYDMTTQEGMNAFLLEFNSRIQEARVPSEPMPGAFPSLLGGGMNLPFFDLPPRIRTESFAEQERRRKARKQQRKAKKKNRR